MGLGILKDLTYMLDTRDTLLACQLKKTFKNALKRFIFSFNTSRTKTRLWSVTPTQSVCLLSARVPGMICTLRYFHDGIIDVKWEGAASSLARYFTLSFCCSWIDLGPLTATAELIIVKMGLEEHER